LKLFALLEVRGAVENAFVRLQRACDDAERGRYGVDAFEAVREANRKKGERHFPTKKLKLGGHTEAREEALLSLVRQFVQVLGVTAEVAVDQKVLRETAREGLDTDWYAVSRTMALVSTLYDRPFLHAVKLCDGDGTSLCSMSELLDVVGWLGVSVEDMTVDGRIRRFAQFSTLAQKVVDGHCALGEAYVIERQKRLHIRNYRPVEEDEGVEGEEDCVYM
jgi:hypothetical protein